MIAKAQRSGSAKVAGELANKGYNSTKKTYYYGMKLHILAFRRCGRLPLPDYIGLTPASEADINILKEIAKDIHFTPIYADVVAPVGLAPESNFDLTCQNDVDTM